MGYRFFAYLLAVIYFIGLNFAFAGIENRPLNSDEATVLNKGKFVIATGLLSLKQPNSDREWAWVTDLEYGIFENLEFDLEIPRRDIDYKDNSNDRKDVDGLGDVATWLEFSPIKEKDILPALSFAFSVKTHTGNKKRNLGTGENNYQFTLLGSKTFGSASYHFNLGFTKVGDPPGTNYRNTFNYNFAWEYILNKKIMFVSEIYGQTNQDRAQDKDPLDILGGFIYNLNNQLAIDFGIGTGLTNASPDLRVTSGMAHSF